ncbi:protein toll-like isoform X1 [Littorina saxatilis]|uniref:protein toll-like isoform X1 n=1 Tax=Littorina saxatilis TaxID=31220 RepID=UPI0038B60E95
MTIPGSRIILAILLVELARTLPSVPPNDDNGNNSVAVSGANISGTTTSTLTGKPGEATTLSNTIINSTSASGNNTVTKSNATTINRTTNSTSDNTTSVKITTEMTNNSTPIITNNTTNVTNASTTSSKGCPDMCHCPDYERLADALVPEIRRLVGSASDQFNDDIIKVFVLQQLVSQGENPKSILFNMLSQYVQSSNVNTLWTAVLLKNAMDGVTYCQLPANVTFVLDAETEARLFPQVGYKNSFLESLNRARGSNDTSSFRPQKGELGPTQLYNISFECKEGARVVISRDSRLHRYGRWSDNCQVSTEGVLVMDRNMSLIRLTKIGGTTAWLYNLTVSDNPGVNDGVLLWNSSSSDALVRNMTSDGSPTLNTYTIFPRIRDVQLWNTTLSVQALSDVLGLFQKATSLEMKHNSLANFNCSQLLPTPASWTNFTLSNTGLKSVPVCLLRPSLISLKLPGNAISDLTPLQYPRLVPAPRMDFLDLSDNDIHDVGVLTDMNVVFLILAGNKISTLNKLSFVRLPQLSWLDLSRNRLRHLEPGSFKSLIWLMQLHLQHNHLQRFDSSLRPLRTYLSVVQCKIFLNNNSFSHPPFREDGYDPGVGFSVYADGNPYACDCDMEQYVGSTVNVGLSGSYEDRDGMRCQYPAPLHGRPLDTVAFNSTCPIVMDCPQGCTCTFLRYNQDATTPRNDSVTNASSDDRASAWSRFNTVTVDCSSVKDLQQPKSLPDKYPLHVKFQGTWDVNATSSSVQDAKYLQRIVSFNLSRRGLTRAPEFLCEALPQAQFLDLSFNKLTRLPDCFHNRANTLPTLELRLAGNPWSCDCDAVSMRSWLAEMTRGGGNKDGVTVSGAGGVRVSDVEEVWCSASTQAGKRVAQWDSSVCEPADYLPWVVSLSVVLGLAVVLGPLLYAYRLKAMVAIHTHLHVRPFTHVHRFKEEDYDHEALVVHGASDACVQWVVNSFLPRTHPTHHRLCMPDRDFVPGASIAESYATAVARSKATLCLLSPDTAKDEWWLYAFQLARAQHARCPHAKLLLVWLENVEEQKLPEEVRTFLKTNTYLSVEDGWFWKKLFFYLPDPPKTLA